MHSTTAHVDLSTLKLINGGEIASQDPFVLACHGKEQLLEVPDASNGFQWRENHYIILDCLAEAQSKVQIFYRWHTGKDVLRTDYSIVPNRRVKMCIRLEEEAIRGQGAFLQDS